MPATLCFIWGLWVSCGHPHLGLLRKLSQLPQFTGMFWLRGCSCMHGGAAACLWSLTAAVYGCRIRPVGTTGDTTPSCVVIGDNGQLGIYNPQSERRTVFAYDKVFDENINQEAVRACRSLGCSRPCYAPSCSWLLCPPYGAHTPLRVLYCLPSPGKHR